MTPVTGASLRSLVLALIALFALVVTGTAAPADAAPADESAVRWSLVPASAEGPDGRVTIEHELDPGESVEDYLALSNLGAEPVTLRLLAADGFFTRTGRFDILPSGEPSTASGTWIAVPESVVVDPGDTVIIPVTITVPERAEPGDHAAGVAASILSQQVAEDGTRVGVESRVGVRVTTRVTGELTPAAEIRTLSASYEGTASPFRPGRARVVLEVANTGNATLRVEGSVMVGSQRPMFPGTEESPHELLPGDVREIAVEVPGVWPLFRVPVHAELTPTVIAMDGERGRIVAGEADAVLWAIPWSQLLVIVGLAFLVGALMWSRRQSRRRVTRMVDEAREAGRREAQVSVHETGSGNGHE